MTHEPGHHPNAAPLPRVKRVVDRDGPDFYPTPSWVTEALLKVERFDGAIWEPACGDGAMAKPLKAAGHSVLSSDLYDRGYGCPGIDFLEAESSGPATFHNVITNPPYHLALPFVLRALALAERKVAMLLRIAWLEGMRRRALLWDRHPPARVWAFSRRVTMYPAGAERGSGGTTAYAWFVWDKGHQGPATLGWLP